MKHHTNKGPAPTSLARHQAKTPVALVAAGILAALLLFSITQGATSISLHTLWHVLTHFDDGNSLHLIVRDLRLPRALASALVGAALAVAGAVMQGITRNPMADSGLLGINAGAGFAMALCFAFFPQIPYLGLLGLAFAGAALGALLVNGAAAAGSARHNPIRLVLAGAAVSTLLAALSQGVSLAGGVALNVLYWTVGGVAGVSWTQFFLVTPVLAAGLAGAMVLAPTVAVLNMGDEIAAGLGINTGRMQALCTLTVLLLAAGSVAVVGPVTFVGLMVPHLMRFLMGGSYKQVIPFSALAGALLLLAADLGARTLNPPFEVPLGVLTSLIGVPFFIALSRRGAKGGAR